MKTLAYVNGQLLPAESTAIALNDRSFLYGDGLFETIRITKGEPFLWPEHIERLQRGAAFLRIPLPYNAGEIENAARQLLMQNDCAEGVLRLHLSRGPSQRGYSTATAASPTLIITTHRSEHPPLRGLKLITSTVRVLADDPLTQHKTANRLPNILARQQADDAGADEALILNHRGEIAEASAANVFCVRERKILTPPLSSGALAGTTRAFILSIAFEHDLTAEERALTLEGLRASNAVFLTSAHWLVAPVIALDGEPICALRAAPVTPPHPIIAALRHACENKRAR